MSDDVGRGVGIAFGGDVNRLNLGGAAPVKAVSPLTDASTPPESRCGAALMRTPHP